MRGVAGSVSAIMGKRRDGGAGMAKAAVPDTGPSTPDRRLPSGRRTTARAGERRGLGLGDVAVRASVRSRAAPVAVASARRGDGQLGALRGDQIGPAVVRRWHSPPAWQ